MLTLINRVQLRGATAAILFGYRDAAVLRDWAVTRNGNHVWTLRATADRVDLFQLRQIPLTFSAPRRSKPRGFWTFPVVPRTLHYDPISKGLSAQLGQPEG